MSFCLDETGNHRGLEIRFSLSVMLNLKVLKTKSSQKNGDLYATAVAPAEYKYMIII